MCIGGPTIALDEEDVLFFGAGGDGGLLCCGERVLLLWVVGWLLSTGLTLV